jgi:tetratricopeptide (TPR) repeat protein
VLAIGVTAAAALAWWSTSRTPTPASDAGHTAPAAVRADAPADGAAVQADAATFLGSDACRDCHAAEHAAWSGSQHDRAMQHATDATVLGNFGDDTFEARGVLSRFYRRDDRFFVRTDGPDGQLTDFEIEYTYGVEPLQQYLVAFPDGRLQALSIAWDTRPRDAGGQRWFHLYPHETIDHRDELHWTRRAQNWNYMCADCHSTNLRKGYDASADTFRTEWSEINVGCEACHGPGSQHAAWARAPTDDPLKGLTVALDERRGVTWTIDASTGNASRSVPKAKSAEIEVCAQCHSRRAQIAEGYHAGSPFLDHYLPGLLEPPQYYPDGQQRDEVYVWGSFLQSRMHAQGVTCSDCHEPHSQQLRAPGDAVCAQCHSASKYAAVSHHFHTPGTAGSACVDCHMPATEYMVIDPRRDHSLRVPRPDLSVALGTPNACTVCHADHEAQWADATLRRWLGHAPGGYQQFAEAFASAEGGSTNAAPRLTDILTDAAQPAFVRASAARALAGLAVPASSDALRNALHDREPLVRLASLSALDSMPSPLLGEAALPLLHDPLRTIRIEAVRRLATVPRDQLPVADRTAFDTAAREFVASQRYNADRPEARAALGSFHAARGEGSAAERELRAAIAIEPSFVPAYVNLADLMRNQGRDGAGVALLREAIERNPGVGALHHALGLALVRAGRTPDALPQLAEAVRLSPDDVRFAWVHAVGLNSAGRTDEALVAIDRALVVHPGNRDLLSSGALFARDAGETERALDYAVRLVDQFPDDVQAAALLTQLKGNPVRQ